MLQRPNICIETGDPVEQLTIDPYNDHSLANQPSPDQLRLVL